MKHTHYQDVPLEDVNVGGANKVKVRWLISEEDGAGNFFMRRFEIQPGGNTPRHEHDWEHEVYIIEGHGSVLTEGSREPFAPGDVIYFDPAEEHAFYADRGEPVAFLCLIPTEGSTGGCAVR
jgi:quercetin dioxygenase-like cupin family protein